MASPGDEESRKLLYLTTFAYRKPGMTEEDYHRYISDFHVRLFSDIMVKDGLRSTFAMELSCTDTKKIISAGPK
ncbi:hypothetical protein MMC21_006550 [Puttea exsequens]|nr:hypothetical protein [Puttea exsequens]